MNTDLISSLQSMHDRLGPVLAEKFGDAFDGDMDTLLDAINHLKRNTTQPPHHDRGEVVTEPGAIRTLVTAANAVLALHPEDDGMWTLEMAVRPFNATKPAECANGCPTNTVCDYCQIAALTEAKQQGLGEAGSPSLKQTPAWWVGYSIGHTGRAPYHCIGPDKPPSQYANDSVHWTPLYTAPQVEAKRQTGEGGLRVIAKRNLKRLIEIGSTDKATMLSCLEELS
jgi:hypothetical protein